MAKLFCQVLPLLLMFMLAQPAAASVFMVTEFYDSVDASPGDTVCADASGRCTLRAAVQESNALAGNDVIDLPAGTYTLSIPGNAEHAAASGDLDLLSAITVRGQGADRTIIDAGGIDRAFESINAGAVLIENLTIENGVAGANTPGYFSNNAGGAIATVGNGSTLTLNGVVLRNNQAVSGGGLHNVYSTVVMNNSTVQDNAATTGSGGGIAEGLASFTRLYNVTLTGNRAAQSGGGMFTSNNTALLYNVTITGNLADSDADGTGNGGGLAKGITAPTLSNSIVAGNSDSGGEAPDCSGGITSNGYNLIGIGDGCSVTPTTGDQIGATNAPIDAGLVALAVAENGVPMHGLAVASPAIDTGNPAVPGSGGAACNATDARGANRTLNTPCDKGAYEVAVFGRSFTVNSFADVVDATPGDGVCETASGNGECTLRAAIQEANRLDGMDTINIPAGTFTLTLAGSGEDLSATGDLDVLQATRIVGAGPYLSIIDGGAQDRVFHLSTNGRVEMQGLTIRNGVVAGGNGGGILLANTGGLDLTDMQITGNSAQSGAGVYASLWSWMNDGMVNLTRCVISANTATQYGGGFSNFTFRTTTIVESTLSDNSAQIGGGLFNSFMSHVLITGSTVSTNQAQTGGGIAQLWGRGVVTLINSTVSGNTATLSGAGFNVSTADITNIFSSTVTNNHALGSGYAGGISSAGILRLANSVLAGNTDASAGAPDCSATVSSLGYNLIGNNAGCSLAAQASDQVGTSIAPLDAGLDVLAFHGEAVAYHLPFNDSPLLNAGNPQQPGSPGNSCPGKDQRNVDRLLNAACDIGAVELRSADISLTASVDPVTAVRAGNMTYTLRISNAGPDTAQAISLALIPAEGSVYVSASGNSWVCTAEGANVLCQGGDLASGSTSDLSLIYTAPDSSGSLSSSAGIATDSWDVNLSNNSVLIGFDSNAPPVITGGSTVTFTGTPDTLPIAATVTVSDRDDTHLESATLRFTSGFVPGSDLLYLPVYSGLSASWDDVNGVLAIRGTASLATYQSVLRNARYTSLSSAPSSGNRNIQIIVNDGVIDSAATYVLLSVPVATVAPVQPDEPGNEQGGHVGSSPVFAPNLPSMNDAVMELDSLQISVQEDAAGDEESDAESTIETATENNELAEIVPESAQETQNHLEESAFDDANNQRWSKAKSSYLTRAGRALAESAMLIPETGVSNGPLEVASIASAEFWQEISTIQAQIEAADTAETEEHKVVVNTVKTATLFLFAGATNWYLKGSALLASLFTSLPLWARFDPLPILALSRRMRKRQQRMQAAADAMEVRYSSGMTRLLDKRAAHIITK